MATDPDLPDRLPAPGALAGFASLAVEAQRRLDGQAAVAARAWDALVRAAGPDAALFLAQATPAAASVRRLELALELGVQRSAAAGGQVTLLAGGLAYGVRYGAARRTTVRIEAVIVAAPGTHAAGEAG